MQNGWHWVVTARKYNNFTCKNIFPYKALLFKESILYNNNNNVVFITLFKNNIYIECC